MQKEGGIRKTFCIFHAFRENLNSRKNSIGFKVPFLHGQIALESEELCTDGCNPQTKIKIRTGKAFTKQIIFII